MCIYIYYRWSSLYSGLVVHAQYHPSLSSFCSISADWVYTTMYLRAKRDGHDREMELIWPWIKTSLSSHQNIADQWIRLDIFQWYGWKICEAKISWGYDRSPKCGMAQIFQQLTHLERKTNCLIDPTEYTKHIFSVTYILLSCFLWHCRCPVKSSTWIWQRGAVKTSNHFYLADSSTGRYPVMFCSCEYPFSEASTMFYTTSSGIEYITTIGQNKSNTCHTIGGTKTIPWMLTKGMIPPVIEIQKQSILHFGQQT